VIEEDDFATDLRLKPARGDKLREEKASRKKPQGCWPKKMTGMRFMRFAESRPSIGGWYPAPEDRLEDQTEQGARGASRSGLLTTR